MKIQSLSIVVPTKKCINNCPFCVSKNHDNEYENLQLDSMFDLDYKDRLEYARDNGTNTIILTGTGEALQNKKFLSKFAKMNSELSKPFYVIELQTTGVYLDDETLKWLRETIRVKTISLSVSDLFNNENNLKTIGVAKKLEFNLIELTKKIKSYGFNLRISLNVLKNIEQHIGNTINGINFDIIFYILHKLNTDQVTFRKMWKSNEHSKIDEWIDENNISEIFFNELSLYIKKNGNFLSRLSFGALQYEVGGENGISAVIDDDCMSDKDIDKNEIKYLILRENAKLYTRWNSKASLIF